MSFQGDVAGIGLGELLQGLARGERNGVLTLNGPSLTCRVGLRRGQLFLLPGPDEIDEIWRERTANAFAEDRNPNLETSRRASIARASRLEAFFRMLDAPNLHFRFEPGPLPPPPHAGVRQDRGTIALEGPAGLEEGDASVYGPSLPVEYLLLEHARISDEVRIGPGGAIFGHDVARAMDPERQSPEVRDFLEQCDGASTLQEIADRLGWPLMKLRGVVGEYVKVGQVRIVDSRELLAGAQREMELSRFSRAASRLSGWVMRTAQPCSPADAQLLATEWASGRLGRALALAEPRVARAVLRSIDRFDDDQRASSERWRALAASHKSDELTLLREVSLRLASGKPDRKTFTDLLRLANSFQDRGHEGRTRMLLRLCAQHLPEGAPTRVELGRRMLEAGLTAEGTNWLLNTARELLARADGDAAMLPIRAILRHSPDHPEARTLLEAAQVAQVQLKRRRMGRTAALGVTLALAVVGLVRYRSYREVQRWAVQVSDQSPGDALIRLQEEFGSEPPTGIAELIARLERQVAEESRREAEDWTARYRRVEQACRFEDPLLGLSLALELPEAPEGVLSTNPGLAGLMGLIASQLSRLADEADVPVDAPLEELGREERLVDLLAEIRALLDSRTLPPEAVSFQFRVKELEDLVRARSGKRAQEREALLSERKEEEQDLLLATARAHAEAGDLERSLSTYQRLFATDDALAQIPALQQEVGKVQAHFDAQTRAIELAEQGRHDEAAQALAGVCQRPIEHLLPHRVESIPPGAQVTRTGGRVRTTPFVDKSGIGEFVTYSFELPGFQERQVEITEPRDLRVFLHRFPERTWQSKNRIEAAPVPSGDDHVVCDRAGRIARLDADSRTLWSKQLDTLSGIARTPLFLPDRPGWLLVVSEGGKVWLVQARDGALEGPRDIGSPVVAGPTHTRGGVSVQFSDGRIGVWTDVLEPHFYQANSLVNEGLAAGTNTAPGTLATLRRGAASGTELVSPWNSWRVRVEGHEYVVLSPEGLCFSAEQKGEWIFMAWEAPKALVPQGRLWVSDAGGLRSYVPDLSLMVPYTR
jgi:tetratricopeptide (TPR) repeat protein